MITEEEARAAAGNWSADDMERVARSACFSSRSTLLIAYAVQELARREADDAVLEVVNKFLDDIGTPSTALGGEGDAEVKVNIYERLRMASRLFTAATKERQHG